MTTRIVAIRHGKPKSEGYATDALRPLSEEGKEIQRRVIQTLKDEGFTPSIVLTSPLLRAQQTAQVVGEFFDVTIEDEAALGNEFDAQRLLERIPASEENKTIFLVGHAPTLADFVNALVGKKALADGLSKSCAAVVDFTDDVALGQGQFVHYYRP